MIYEKLQQLKYERANNISLLDQACIDTIHEIVESVENDTEVLNKINHIISKGCESGTVSTLIDYEDTHAFYAKHFEDIHKLVESEFDNTGFNVLHNIELNQPLYNTLVWWSFEVTILKLSNMISIEVH